MVWANCSYVKVRCNPTDVVRTFGVTLSVQIINSVWWIFLNNLRPVRPGNVYVRSHVNPSFFPISNYANMVFLEVTLQHKRAGNIRVKPRFMHKIHKHGCAFENAFRETDSIFLWTVSLRRCWTYARMNILTTKMHLRAIWKPEWIFLLDVMNDLWYVRVTEFVQGQNSVECMNGNISECAERWIEATIETNYNKKLRSRRHRIVARLIREQASH